jgi:hypothetical protein
MAQKGVAPSLPAARRHRVLLGDADIEDAIGKTCFHSSSPVPSGSWWR